MLSDQDILAQAATEARGLAIDAVHAAGIGHLGLPLGCAEIGAVLYGKALQQYPGDVDWLNRDRLVLSAGHGSMFLYAWMHLAGYPIPMEEVKNFRQLHSITPGHPESHLTPGVETTTGPLGQGTANAVGMAMAAKMCEAKYNTTEHTIFDHRVVCIASDGCIQEGIGSESASLAGHLGLDNLIQIYDNNEVTLDAPAEETMSEDVARRYEAYGWDVITVDDGHNMEEFSGAFEKARNSLNGKPHLIMVKTLIGKGIEQVQGTWKAHGESGHEYAEESRSKLGLPEETFYVSAQTREYFAAKKKSQEECYRGWQKTFAAWQEANPALAEELAAARKLDHPPVDKLLEAIPEFPDKPDATRGSVGTALLPNLVSGSADLHGSTKNYLKDLGDFTRSNRKGRNVRFGIREHAMGGIVNGFGYYGLWRASGATFAVFSDYMRPSVRLSALARLPVFFIWTHDSVGVGEDGPTHQPVEHAAALRAIPHLDVIRPADGEESAGAVVAAIERKDGPTALILSRQKLPNLKQIPVKERREGVLRGGYIARKEKGELKLILIGTGSELQLCMEAADQLGEGVRVVSLPCWERFERQDSAYRESVLPGSCRKRVSIEAGVTLPWHKYVGFEGKAVGIDQFGLSAPGSQVLAERGMTTGNLVAAAKEIMAG